MDAVVSKNKPTFTLEMLRDDVQIVRRSGGDVAARRAAIAKMKRLRKRIPVGLVDTVAEVRLIRDSGGRD